MSRELLQASIAKFITNEIPNYKSFIGFATNLDPQLDITWLRDNITSRYNYTVSMASKLTDGSNLAQLEQLKNELLEVIDARISATQPL
jgi:hypothetical protein